MAQPLPDSPPRKKAKTEMSMVRVFMFESNRCREGGGNKGELPFTFKLI